ncbi:MAG: permease [Candidatus Omnitrophota bacterium]|nr:permease [Candidatus Omnitrophota bacterium]
MTNKTVLVALMLGMLMMLSFAIPVLVPFRQALAMYFRSVWWAILLGLTVGGIIDYYIPQEYFSFLLAKRQKRTILNAIGLGFLMSVCSHGILAIAVQLYKKGASTSAVIAFLLSSPWANLPITLMLIGFFGLTKALYIMFSAMIIALTTGWIYQLLEHHRLVETNSQTLDVTQDYSVLGDMKKRFRQYRFSGEQLKKDICGIFSSSAALSNMVLWWILVGIGLASLAGAYIPQHFFHQYMGPTLGGMLVTLATATVIEVCSEGTAPLAFEIFRQTGALGNSLVFLMAGVATDYTEIGILWQNIGRKAACWLPAIAVPQIVFWGTIANIIF